MTANEMVKAIGQIVLWKASADIRVSVRVTNVKQSYGQTRLEIAPLQGAGSQWVNVESLCRSVDGKLLIQH